jgi:integrase
LDKEYVPGYFLVNMAGMYLNKQGEETKRAESVLVKETYDDENALGALINYAGDLCDLVMFNRTDALVAAGKLSTDGQQASVLGLDNGKITEGFAATNATKLIYDGKTLFEAEKALNEYNADPYTISKKTLEEVYQEWYAQRELDKEDRTLEGYRTAHKHLEPLMDMKVKDIDRYELQKYVDYADVTRIALKKSLQLLNMLFEYAVKRSILPVSALYMTKAIDIPIKPDKVSFSKSVISKADIARLWDMKDNESAKIILFYIYTGTRYSELYNLTPDCWHKDHIEIRQAKTKAGVRIVPICDKLQALMPIKDIPPYYEYSAQFKAIFPSHTPHETRHTFITMMTEAQIDDRIIKAIVGHKTKDVTEIYTHISLETMLNAVNTL